jgi:hypothetical protein
MGIDQPRETAKVHDVPGEWLMASIMRNVEECKRREFLAGAVIELRQRL